MMTINSKHDPFRIVFDVLQSSLSGATSVDCEKSSRAESSNDDDILSSATEKELHQSVLSRLGNVKILRELTMQRLSSKILLDSAKIGVIESSHCQAEANCLRHEELTKRRLEQQLQAAERSMRELVFEIIGEYGKSEVRISRRQNYLLNIAQLKLVRRISQLRWQRFSLRLCDSLSCRPPTSCDQMSIDQANARDCRITGKVLCPINDNLEMISIAASIGGIFKRRSLQISPAINIMAAIKLSRVQYHQKKIRLSILSVGSDSTNNNSSNKVINPDGRAPTQRLVSSHHRPEDALLISTPAEFQIIFDRLLKWTKDDGFDDVSLSKVDKAEYDSNKFLSSYHIAWLHPPSYYPILWGKVALHGKQRNSVHEISFTDTYLDKIQSDVEGYPHNVPEADNNQKESSGEGYLDAFISKYSLQHTSLLASDRIYFCLEERNLLAPRKSPMEETLGGSSTREHLTLELQGHLQDIYCQSADSSFKSDTNSAIETLRNILTSEPLYVEEYLHVHRYNNCSDGNTGGMESIPKGGETSALDIFPDVIKIHAHSGESMHFAPACALNLVETKGFQHIISRRCRAMSVPDPETSVPAEEEEYDWAAKVTASVSYPDIQNAFPALFKMDADYFLERLFCLVLVTPVPNMGSLASNTGTVRRRDPYQIMMPLSDPCMRELLTNSLPSMERSCGHRQYIEDMLQILPDHAGYRHSEHHCELPTHNLRSDEDEANQVTSLNHKYFLLPGAELVDNDASSLIVGNNSYYLVQLDDDSIGRSVDDDEKQPDQFDAIQQEDKILSRVLAKLAGGDTLESSCPPKLHRGLSNNSLLEIQMKRTLNERQETQVTTPFASGPNLRSVSEDGGTQIGLNAPKKWDITVLSSLCRWRSCLCEGSRTSPFLCTYHSELKSFLDIRSFSNTQSDAAKFLPRRNPPSSSTTAPSSSTPNLSAAASNLSLCRRDLTSIRAASTLLQELWDGKLKSTIKTFLKKTTHDMRFKIRLQTASSKAVVENEKLLYCYSPEKPSLIGTVSRSAGDNFRLRKSSTASKTLRLPKPPGDVMLPDSGGTNMRNVKSNFSLSFVTMPLIPGDPPWAVWKCKELFDRTRGGSSEAKRLLIGILEAERSITIELKLLSDLKVFPSQELLLVRKEMKAFRDKIIVGKLEKLEKAKHDADQTKEDHQIISNVPERKDEQEAKSVQSRKNAKNKAMHEVQSRDPSNFTNQRRF